MCALAGGNSDACGLGCQAGRARNVEAPDICTAATFFELSQARKGTCHDKALWGLGFRAQEHTHVRPVAAAAPAACGAKQEG